MNHGIYAFALLVLSGNLYAQLSPDEARARMAEINRHAATQPVSTRPTSRPIAAHPLVKEWRIKEGAPVYISEWIAGQPAAREAAANEILHNISTHQTRLDVAKRNLSTMSSGRTSYYSDTSGTLHPFTSSDTKWLRNDIKQLSDEISQMKSEAILVRADTAKLYIPELDMRLHAFGSIKIPVRIGNVLENKSVAIWYREKWLLITDVDVKGMVADQVTSFAKPLVIYGTSQLMIGEDATTVFNARPCDYMKEIEYAEFTP